MFDDNDFSSALKEIGIEGLQFERSAESNVTLAWGVNWQDDEISRDVIQNFFDANRDQIDAIEIRSRRDRVEISAPSTFDLKKLYFLGSEKDPASNVGQYGEGFKAAAVSYLREPGRYILAASHTQAVAIAASKRPVDGTQKLYPLIYHFYRCAPVPQSRLILANCSLALSLCMGQGLENFFFPKHSRLGKRLCSNGKVTLYKSTQEDGCIFYRNLKRGELPGMPFVFVFERPYRQIEKKIGADRDRKAFGSDLRTFFLNFINTTFLTGNTFAQRQILETCRPQWEQGKGNALLEIMSRGNTSDLCEEKAELFGDGFYARCKLPDGQAGRIQHLEILGRWKTARRAEVPAYFADFGVETIDSVLKELEARAMQESLVQGRRELTLPEQNALHILETCLATLAPVIVNIFKNGKVVYSVAKTETLLGQLKTSRSYRSREVFFSEQIFGMKFSAALSLFAHEHGHVFGYDSSRGFTDCLTELLESAIANRSSFDSLEAQWEDATIRIHQINNQPQSEIHELAQQALALPLSTLVERFNRLPLETVQRLVLGTDHSSEESQNAIAIVEAIGDDLIDRVHQRPRPR